MVALRPVSRTSGYELDLDPFEEWQLRTPFNPPLTVEFPLVLLSDVPGSPMDSLEDDLGSATLSARDQSAVKIRSHPQRRASHQIGRSISRAEPKGPTRLQTHQRGIFWS